jgi:hypothetical protein
MNMIYEVEVIRTASRTASIKVNAASREEAEMLALEEAGGVHFSSAEKDAVYEVSFVKE